MLCYVVCTLMMSAVVVQGANYTEAFGTYLGVNLINLAEYQTLKFNDVVYNSNDYSPTTGVFTAERNGTYMFAFSIGHRGTGILIASLIYKPRYSYGRVVSEGVAQGLHAIHFAQGGNHVIVQMEPYDKVWLRIAWQTEGTTMMGYYPLSSFSGFLINES